MLDTKEKPVEGKVTEPSRQWLNWYETDNDGPLGDGRFVRKGDRYPSPLTPYPSKEIAEQKSAEHQAAHLRRWGVLNGTYLGAFPVEAS